MRVCILCAALFESSANLCPVCAHEPERIEGYPAFAPRLAYGNDGFDARYFAELERLEAGNFWFRSRNRLICWAMTKYFPDARSLLEIGCGTGFVLSGIKCHSPSLNLFGSEIFSAGLSFAANRVPSARFFQMDARFIPFVEEFDVVSAFDVLEHIDDDTTVLRQMWRATRKGGGLILTVPQHRFLWSQQDEFACHRRRYEAVELRQKVSAAGFEIMRVTSFVTLLLPLMLMSRLRSRHHTEPYDGMAELRIGRIANWLLEQVMRLDLLLIRAGASLPAGGSLLLIARKP